jgi:hypothetical protein
MSPGDPGQPDDGGGREFDVALAQLAERVGRLAPRLMAVS